MHLLGTKSAKRIYNMGKKRCEKNESEALFEEYLASNNYMGWDYEPQIHGQTKRPDYRLNWQGREYLFEVKELREKEPRPEPSKATWINPYKALRGKINEARKKFKNLKDYCCSLVVCNIGDWQARLDSQIVFGVMFGDLGFTMDFDKQAGILVLGTERPAFLGQGKMIRYKTGEPQNTTINSIIVVEKYTAKDPNFLKAFNHEVSQRKAQQRQSLDAIEILKIRMPLYQRYPRHSWDVPRVVVIENPYARHPLHRDLFNGPYDERYVLEGASRRIFAGNALREIEELESKHSGHD
jgi:hypothetical protein